MIRLGTGHVRWRPGGRDVLKTTGGRTLAGVYVRVAARLLGLAAVI